MAIKVKHEGNVTSRAYASAAGGKGKRQAEDAKVLSAMQRGGSGGGGGTGGGARAGGSAPTLSAPTSSAALGSPGSLIAPTKSFGQEKALQAQRDEAAMERQKEHDRAAMERLLESQRWQGETVEAQRVAKEAERLAEERRKAESLSDAEKGFDAEQQILRRDIRAKIASIQADKGARESERAAAIKELQDELNAMTPAQKPLSLIDEFNKGIVVDPVTNARYRKNARGEFELMETPSTPQTPEQIWNSSYLAPNGVRYISDGRGGLVPIPDPNAEAAKVQSAVEQKQSQKELDHYNKFVEGKLAKRYEMVTGEGNAFDREKEMEAIKEEYRAIYGIVPLAEPIPTAQAQKAASPTGGSQSTMSPEELKNKYRKNTQNGGKLF